MGRVSATVAILLSASGALAGLAEDRPANLREAASPKAVVRDWMPQDYMGTALPDELEHQKQQWRDKHLRARESKPDPPVLKDLGCFVSDRDSVVERRMIDRVLEELGERGKPLRAAVEALVQANLPGSDPRWKQLYVRGCEMRRASRLQPLLARWKRFVFSRHRHVKNSWKYTEGLSNAQSYRFFAPGASLSVLEMDGIYGKLRTLLEDPVYQSATARIIHV